ncbi:DUF4064 domain-containing protein [Radiobacillus sp. PE A8.2]|uniref:DUF4064 domain-containing protein n=1 Tax=Radiobacillus sp. PE A8.2 TaxID=3380349 RepID=UPI003890DE55
MKRTGEIVLGIIGIIMYAISAGIGWFMIWMTNNEDMFREEMENAEQGSEVPMADMDALFDMIGSGGTLLLIVSLVATVLGIVAMILLRGNKNPKLAGIILIVVSVAVALITVGAAIFPGIFYLVAGIMCLARKPKQMLEM